MNFTFVGLAAALPQHSAESLWLSGNDFFVSSRGYASGENWRRSLLNSNQELTVSLRLTALWSGRAASWKQRFL
jgi:hypothetical protein